MRSCLPKLAACARRMAVTTVTAFFAAAVFTAFAAVTATAIAGCSKKRTKKKKRLPPTSVEVSTPEETFKLQYQYIRSKDVDSLWHLYTERMKKGMKRMVDQLQAFPTDKFKEKYGFDKSELEGLDIREVMRKMAEAPGLTNQEKKTPKIERVEKGSDRLVIIRYTRLEAQCAQRLAKEAGGWKIDAPAVCKLKESRTKKAAKDPQPVGRKAGTSGGKAPEGGRGTSTALPSASSGLRAIGTGGGGAGRPAAAGLARPAGAGLARPIRPAATGAGRPARPARPE